MYTLVIVLLILAAVCFLAEVIKVKAQVSFIGLGLLFWVVAVLIPVIQS
jgi:hypothetical protein